jgi:hypothetical protein
LPATPLFAAAIAAITSLRHATAMPPRRHFRYSLDYR